MVGVELGMLNQVVMQGTRVPTVTELAQSLAAKNANAVMVSKATVNAVVLTHTVLRPDLLLARE
jgi:ABC-type amino acid transport substrate-binding protein